MCNNAIYDSVMDRYICNLDDEECFFADPDSQLCFEQYKCVSMV